MPRGTYFRDAFQILTLDAVRALGGGGQARAFGVVHVIPWKLGNVTTAARVAMAKRLAHGRTPVCDDVKRTHL